MEYFDSSLIESIEMRLIKHAPFEVRRNIDKNHQELESLASSIREHGLLQPILVRPITHGFELVAGHRRFEACRTLRRRFIQCKIRDLSDKQAYEIQISENIQRRSLDPIEEAEAFKRYVEEFGWGSIRDLAIMINKSEEYVSHRMQLLKLGSEIRQQIIQKNITSSHGMELLGIPQEIQSSMMQKIIDEKLTVKEIRKMKSGNAVTAFKYDDKKTKPEKIAKKTTLALKITLAKFDSIIDDINTISEKKSREFLIPRLMEMRYKIHDMIDDSIKIQKDKNLAY